MHLLLLLAWKLDEVVEERMGEREGEREGWGQRDMSDLSWDAAAYGENLFGLSRSATSTFCCCSSCFHVFGQFIARQTRTYRHTVTHTHTVAVDIWKPHGNRAGFSVNIFSKQQAAHSIFLVPHVRVYFRYHCTCTPQNSLHVCTHQTPDTHTSRHTYTHTHLKHMHCFVQLVILLIFFLRCISVCSSLR